jgi:membrane-bound serine protease (ClpP class)
MVIESIYEKVFLAFFLLAFAVCYVGAQQAGESAAGSGSDTDKVAWIIPVRGDIEPSLGAFVRKEARTALSKGASYIIFEIDTFGGRVDTALQISSFIVSIKGAKTVAWVRSGPESLGVSWSTGALIKKANHHPRWYSTVGGTSTSFRTGGNSGLA